MEIDRGGVMLDVWGEVESSLAALLRLLKD